MRVDSKRDQAGDGDADLVERLEAGRASDAKELPSADGGGDGDECRERRASEQQDGDRDGSRDHPEENATRELGAHTSMISASFALINSSILWMKSSCTFCRSFSACLTSSSDTPLSFLSNSRACVRAWRTATLPSSAYLCTTFTSSLRRCSFIMGSGTRMIAPCVDGSSPSPDSRIAFSTIFICPLSNGVTIRTRGSGAFTVAT